MVSGCDLFERVGGRRWRCAGTLRLLTLIVVERFGVLKCGLGVFKCGLLDERGVLSSGWGGSWCSLFAAAVLIMLTLGGGLGTCSMASGLGVLAAMACLLLWFGLTRKVSMMLVSVPSS